jgi:prevent-host-death family protein
MIKTLRESKAKLSELVKLASGGEDVLISVRGKVKARLTGVPAADYPSAGTDWARELRSLQRVYSTGRHNATIEKILAEDRESRG